MELPVTRAAVRISAPVLDTSADHPVDSDIVLPDYCPDISRVLKTEGCAQIDARQADGAHLNVSGTFTVRVLYLAENSRVVRCLSHETAFTHVFDLKDACEEVRSRVRVRVAYVNCRLIGPRRVQIRASLALRARAVCDCEETFVSAAEDERTETLALPVRVSTHVGTAEKPFEVRETLELGPGKPPAAAVIKADTVAVVQDYKLISNKVIVKGELHLKTFYSAEADDGEGGVEVMEHTIPISQILDLPGVDEDCGCTLRLTPGPAQVAAQPDAQGENRLLDVQLTVTAVAVAFRTDEVAALRDAFSPEYALSLEKRAIPFSAAAEAVHATEMVRQTAQLQGVELAAVTDASVSAHVTEARVEDGALLLKGELAVSVFGTDAQGGPACADATVPFAVKEPVKTRAETVRADPEVQVISSSFTLAGPNRLDVRAECVIDACVFAQQSASVVTALDLDDSEPKEQARQKTLTLYFAEPGESVWEIAKRYNTSPARVKQENRLEEDTLPARRMLLIPRRRPRRLPRAES